MRNRRLILERLEERILLAADPVAAVEVADTNFINEDINFTVSFDNIPDPAGTDVGYQPHLDVVVEKGVEVSSASYLGSGVTLNQVAFWDATDSQWEDAANGLGNEVTEHPQDPTGLGSFSLPGAGNKTGDVWYSIQLPFGSFAHDQPKVAIDFTATLDSSEGAVVGTPLAIKAIGNFAFGSDALNNPGTDAPLQGTEVSSSITPTVWTIDKTIIAPETETATGPSFPRTWQIEIDIANGQTVTDIDISDVLPNNLDYVDGSIAIDTTGAAAANGQTITQTPTSGQVNNAPDSDFQIEFASVTGTTAKDIVITYQAYVNNLDADGGNVINPVTGDDTSSVNNASADGSYLGSALAQITDTETLQDKSIAIQKSVAIVGGGATVPGAFAEYTLEFQISDYFSFDDLVIDDTFSDGLLFDNTFIPTFTVTENGTTVATTEFDPGNFTVNHKLGTTGFTDVELRLSDQLSGTAVGAELSGDQFNGNAAGDGGTIGTIKFRVEIQEDFTDTFISGDDSVDMGDVLTNTVAIAGDVKNTDGTDTGSEESDDSSADLTIDQIQATKSIYAIDGNTGFTNVALTPGETVTYRIKVDLASADAEKLIITDFLPLPILTATSVAANTFASAPSGTVPVAGSASFGPDHTLHNATLVRNNGDAFNGIPTINTDVTNNTVQFDFGTFDDNGAGSGPQVIDILFTVAANDEPFGDGLFLTNQALVDIGSTNGSTEAITEIVQIEVEEPELVLKKGIVSTNAGASSFSPGTVGPVVFDAPNDPSQPFTGSITSAGLAANPIDSNLTGVDAGDLVKFAVVLENTGQEDAFDLLFNDQLPSSGDFEIPSSGEALNFKMYNGAGTALTFVDETGAALANDAAIAAKFFSTVAGEGVRIDDTASGTIAAGKDSGGTANSTGDNIIIITYDLQAKADINPATVHTGTAELVEYSVQEAGNDFTAGNTGLWNDAATVTAISPIAPDKKLENTQFDVLNNSDTQAVIGETVQYSVEIILPEGEIPVAQLRDVLDDGLTFFSLDSVVASAGVTTSLAGGLANTGSSGTGEALDPLIFSFGDLTNANTDNNTDEKITLTYTVQVENINANQQDSTLNNQARFQWDANNNGTAGDNSSEFTVSDNAANVTVIEPQINTAVSAVVNDSGTTGDIGDSVVYTITLTSEAGRPEAFDAIFEDIVPSDINIGTVTVDHSVDGDLFTSGTGDFELSGKTVQTASGKSFDLAQGESITITVNGTLASTVSAGQTITNSATTEWTSIDGAGPNASGNSDGERTGTGGVNDYTDTQSTDIQIAAPAEKTIVSTSEGHTEVVSDIENLAIGEIVRYRLQFKLPESTSTNVILKDNLPEGLQFLNDGTAKIAFVANGGGISSSDPSASAGEDWSVAAGASVNGNSILTPTFELQDQNISTSETNNNDTYGSGSDVYFKLGDLVNSDLDSDAEYVIVEFNAVALNNPGNNNADDTRDNNFELLVSGASVSTSSVVTTRIAEPVINNLAKSVTVTPSEAGDTISYQYTFSNTASGNGATTAFDINLIDVLDSNLDLKNVTDVTFSSTGIGSFTNNSNISTDTVGVVLDQLEVGQSATITVVAAVKATAPAGIEINSTANLTYTSLPGDNGTIVNATDSVTPGVSGADTGERDGSESIPANDYKDTAAALITLDTPTIDQLQPVPAAYSIGDTVTYDIVVTLPEGVTRDLQVSDALPAGLSFVSSQIITTAGGPLTNNFNGSVTSPAGTSTGGSGDDVSWNFGDTTTANNNNSNDNKFLIRVTALVENEAGNQDAKALTTDAEIRWTNPNDSSTDSTNDPTDPVITVVEPVLQINKTLNTSDTGVDAGDTVQYTIVITHTGASTADAFDLNITDQLPAELENITIVSGLIDATDITNSLSINGLEQLVSTGDAINLVQGQTLTIVVSGTVQNDVNPDDILSSAATVTWSSIDGVSADERDGSGGVNDYTASDSAPDVPVVDPFSVTKIANASTAVIDDSISYTLEVSVVEGTTSGLNIVDTLPAGMVYGGDATVSDANGITISNFAANISGQTLTLTADTILNPAGSDDASTADSDSFFITYSVRIDNVIGNQQGTTLINDADASADNVAPDNDNQTTVTVNEPVLTVSASTSGVPAIPNISDTFQFITSVDHTGTSTATANDLQLTDTMPPELKIISIDSVGGTNSLGLTPADFTITGGGSSWTLNPGFDLVLADDFTLIYTVEILSTINLNQGLSNDVDISWDSIDGADSNARDGSDGPSGALNDYAATANAFITTNNLSIDKVINTTDQSNTIGNDVVIGEIITYELTINLSETTTSNVIVNDSLPQQLSYIPGSMNVVTGNAGMTTQYVDENTSLSYNETTRILTVNLGDIANPDNSNISDDTVILRYQAVVENDINNQNRDVKTNNVIVTSIGGSATDTTDAVILEPELEISLVVSNNTPIINETIQYTLTVDHTSNSDTDAFDLTLTNILADPDLTITGIDSIGGSNDTGLNVNDFVITPDGSGIAFAESGRLDLGLTDDFTLAFSVKVSGDVGSIGNVNDTSVDLSWSSIDGSNSKERDGSGGVNDYSATISQDVTLLPVPPKPPLPIFVFDASHNDAEEDDEDSFFHRAEERIFTLPPLPIFPIFSGATEPGTTLNFKLYNEAGAEIGSQTVMADTGGNWLANFPGNIMFDQPHSMRIEQTASVVSNDAANGFNLRTYFSPAMNEQLFFSHAYTPETVFSNTASVSLQAIHQGLNNPFNLGGGDFYAYEYLSSSSTTTQGH